MTTEKRTTASNERDPRDPNDIRPFSIERGMTPDPAWVVRLSIADNQEVVLRAKTYDECVDAIAPFFLPERRLLFDRARTERIEAAARRALAALDKRKVAWEEYRELRAALDGDGGDGK